jgi:tetratricopeptide (TPR) repeat protein
MTSPLNIRDALAALNADPARAAAICHALLSANPQNAEAELVLSEALRLVGDLAGARAAAEAQTKARPQWFGAHRQLGLALADMGQPLAAAASFSRAGELNPRHPTIWRELGDQLTRAGDVAGAQAAYARHAALPPAEPHLVEAARMLAANNFVGAEPILRDHLAKFPNDVAALRMLSEAQARADRPDLAEATLRRCLDLAPDFGLARHSLGQLLNGLGRYDEALEQAQELLRRDPTNRGSQRLYAATQNNRGEYEAALAVYEKQLADNPAQPSIWASRGHLLKTVGRTEEAIAAYKKSLQFAPGSGLPYWSLANLKTYRFTAEDRAEMERQLGLRGAAEVDRVNLHFALGKAYEDVGDYERAFSHYKAGSDLHRANAPHDAARLSQSVDEAIATCTPSFFAERVGAGAPDLDPIFILGLPRSGSTLVEQILASHSQVEGTMELPHLLGVVRELGGLERGGSYLKALASLPSGEIARFGEHYLRATRAHRKLGRVYFIDKMPNNWSLIGLIHVILPNAKLIDARRHPMACCVSCYKQHFALGQSFTYDLTDLGRYYADYVRLMAHWDRVLPGRVHRVIHEDLAADPEPHIRALLEYCGLPFEEACLRPHETQRPVMTASSEQVRQPITAKGLDEWRKYQAWIGPMEEALGETITTWRG